MEYPKVNRLNLFSLPGHQSFSDCESGSRVQFIFCAYMQCLDAVVSIKPLMFKSSCANSFAKMLILLLIS